jgi:poly-beta-hydroxyalkanoate depolymerase
LYLLHEASHFMFTPARVAAGITRLVCESPFRGQRKICS